MRQTILIITMALASIQATAATFPSTLNGKDFFQYRSDKKTPPSAVTDCRANISKVICLAEPVKDREKPDDRKCLPGGEAYAGAFEDLYDHYPPVLQKMFCSLTHIFIEKEFVGTAYAGTMRDATGKMTGAVMGIRQSVLDEKLTLQNWATWKEQLSFGGATDSYTSTPGLPQIEVQAVTTANAFLYFVVAHEFGHILDFANEVNKTKNCSPEQEGQMPECDMHEDSWGALSWKTNHTPKPENDFLNRTGLCFYWCDSKPLQKAHVPQVYAGIANTSFISLYATQQPWDDFADSLAYFAMYKNLGATYLIHTEQGETYDIMARLTSPAFSAKYNYLDTFIQRTDLIYP